MTIDTNVALRSLTTLKVGGVARAVAYVSSLTEVEEAVLYATDHNLPFYVLGEGSNVLPSDEGFAGLIIRMQIGGISFEEKGEEVVVHSGAGVSWDGLVREVAERELWGFENLAGIPGTVGATPVQNIGAYGADISQTLRFVSAYDTKEKAHIRIPTADCALGYRDSRFKHEPNLIITHVTFALTKHGQPHIEYGDLQKAKEQGVDLSTPEAIGNAVRAIRAEKFPDLSVFGTAGSFFKNPVLTPEQYAKLTERYGAVPQFPNPHGIKVPLAFILDKVLGMRGFRLGNAFLFGAQPLVLVVDAGGMAHEVELLAREVEKRVKEETGITIEREVRVMPK